MRVTVGAKSDVGRVREANEDSYLIHDPFFAVADGMGGHLAGDVASSTAVEIIAGQSGTASAEDLDSLAELLRSANKAIWEKSERNPALKGMGTTCTLALIDGDRVHLAHVGDSRAYLLRDGELSQLTEDHSLVGRMVREGKLSAEEAEHHPQRSIITRALGVDSNVEVDITTIEMSDGDRLLLCSDGLSSMASNARIQEVLERERDAQTAAERLVDLGNESGGEDNITVVVVDFAADGGAGDGRAAALGSASASSGGGSLPRSSVRPPPPPPGPPESPDRSPPAASQDTFPDTRKGMLRRIALALLLLILVAGGAVAARRYVMTNNWYLAPNGSDNVAVFRGLPDDIFGVAMSTEELDTGIPVADLPEDFACTENIKSGHEVESRDAAVAAAEACRQQGQESRERAGGTDGGDTTGDGGAGDATEGDGGADGGGGGQKSERKNN